MPTTYRDRATGRIETEQVFGGGALHTLYAAARPLTDHVLTRPLPNRIYGWFQRSPLSRRQIAGFAASLGIDTSEAERPLSEYDSLDDFFCRRLKPGARPIDPDPGHAIAPADGRVLVLPRVEGTLRVKGAELHPEELLGDERLASRYRGGSAMIVRLAPADYHRFHFPEAGLAGDARAIPGRLHSVHPIALEAGAPSFRNKRTVTLLETERAGLLALVEVGALCVGTIEQTYRPGRVERGDEKGTFHMGGSTVVVFYPPDRVVFDDDLLESSAEEMETLVRTGTRIGRLPG